MMNAIAGPDPRDPTTAPEPVPEFTASLKAGIRGLKLGVPRNYYFDGIQPEVESVVRAAIDHLRGEGAEITEVTIPAIEFSMPAGFAIVLPEASSYHQSMLRPRADDYNEDVRQFLEAGELILATHYLKAQRARSVIKQGFRTALQGLDALLAPTLPATAARSDTLTVELDGQPVGVIDAYVRTSFPANLSGLPALTVPCGFSSENLPIGLQIIGRPFDEATVLRIGQAYEASTNWHKQKPPL